MCSICFQILERHPDYFGDDEPCMAKHAQGTARPDMVVMR